MTRANLGSRKSAVENRVSRRRRRRTGEPEIARDVDSPIARYVRNIPVSDAFRYGDYTHVSDLIHKCMRMVALAGDLKVPVPVEPNWQSMKLVHAMGHAAHDYIKDIVLTANPNVFGHWKCLCGRKRIGPCIKGEIEHDPCLCCNQECDIYDEFTLHNEEYGLVGNCDIAVKDGDFLVLSELKSISKNQFDDLRDAKPDHKLQLLLYIWMAEQAGFRVHPTSSVFYACREWMIGNPYKEFNLDSAIAERRVTPLLQEATAIKAWRNGGEVPARSWCNRPEDSRAKKCGMCAECFLRG